MELVCAGLVDPHDSVPISMNLEKLLDAQVTPQVTAPPKAVTFHLVSISLKRRTCEFDAFI